MARWAFFVLFVASINSWSQETGSVAIPLKVIKKPAADLLGSNGSVLDVGEAAELAEKGYDLSLLNPQDNRLWQNKKYDGQEGLRGHYPAPEVGVRYLSTEAKNVDVFTHLSRVSAQDKPEVYYRLTLSRRSHNTLMRATLLRKLGYYLYNPIYYPKLRIYFENEEAKEDYIREVDSNAVVTNMREDKWILEDDKKNHSLLVADVMLEIPSPDYYDIANGTAPHPRNPEAVPALQRLSRYRAFRALVLPYVLLDIPESINRFSPKLCSIMAGHVVMMYPYAPSFEATSPEDVRWILRRMLSLTEQDYREIVAAGKFPAELNELIYAKIIYRLRNAGECFDLNSDFKFKLPNLEINSPSGLVQKGKVTREHVPGYPIRFAHGDREAPIKDGDFMRYLKDIHSVTAVMATAIGEINKKLQVLKFEDIMTKRQQTIRNRIIQHVKTKPNEPLYQKVEAWGGMVGGFNVSTNRVVATGTYYDSSAPIQLVDNMSISASVGPMYTIDGVQNWTPMFGANVSVMRDYTHVRPVNSMEDATNVEWKQLFVPGFMNKLGDILLDEKRKVKEGDQEIEAFALDVFMSELRPGEVFTITDSVITSAYAQMMSSFDVLLGLKPLNFMNTISFGADASRVILRQTSFMKTPRGIQVFVRHQNGKVFGLTFDVNYFINLLRVRAQTQDTDLKSDVFVIDYSRILSEGSSARADAGKAKELEETRKALRPALWNLFKHNDAGQLYENFEHKKFNIEHNFKTKELNTKILFWRSNQFSEDHWATIKYPKSKEAPELNPDDEKVLLFSHKKGQLVGRDLLGLGIETLEATINRKSKVPINLGSFEDPNPANTPFGKAYWRLVNTEADLSPKGERFPNVALLSHVWGGWKMKREEFLKLLDQISDQFKETKIGSYRLIEKEAFLNVKSIDFFRVTAMLSVLPSGVSKIRDLINQPGAVGKPQEKHKYLAGLFQKLSKKLGQGARPQEKEMYKEILTILGNGDYKKGEDHYLWACKEHYRGSNGDGQVPPGFWRNGNNYECLIPWMDRLMKLSAKYPIADETQQVRWMTEVLYILDEYIPIAQILKYLGEPNYIFTIRINGFRTGDEDGDLEYFSNTMGDPPKNIDYANGLFQMYANKTGITPIELDRTMGGFK